MAEGSATRSSRGHRTICLPVSEDAYMRAVNSPAAFRNLLDEGFRTAPELFPPNFARGYELKDDRMSVKQGLPIRRILLKDGTAFSVRPSFLMPYLTARTAEQLGAKLLVPPTDIPKVGRFCVIKDPQGAVINAITYKM